MTSRTSWSHSDPLRPAVPGRTRWRFVAWDRWGWCRSLVGLSIVRRIRRRGCVRGDFRAAAASTLAGNRADGEHPRPRHAFCAVPARAIGNVVLRVQNHMPFRVYGKMFLALLIHENNAVVVLTGFTAETA